MKALIQKISELKKSPVKKVIDKRISQFQRLGEKSSSEIFKELCFCILTANYSADGGIRIQRSIGNGFCSFDEARLAEELKSLGYRFPNKRAEYISCAQGYKRSIKKIISSYKDEMELRDWIAENIKGLGFKEASHFLRNIGFENLAIIDFHIIDILADHDLISRPKSLTKKAYLEIEEVLRKIAEKADLTLAELDLYLWYLETGKVLK